MLNRLLEHIVFALVTEITSSHSFHKQSSEAFYRKNVLKNLSRPKGPQFYWKETPAQVFCCEFCENFKNAFLQSTLRQVLLIFINWEILPRLLQFINLGNNSNGEMVQISAEVYLILVVAMYVKLNDASSDKLWVNWRETKLN